MRLRLNLAFSLVVCAAILPAHAAHTTVRLILAADAARPGDTLQAGIHLQMDPGWHTYWKNAGQSGLPTTITWQLPTGVTAGEIQWPLPKKVPETELTTYVYEGEAVLLVPLKLASDVKPGTLVLKAKLDWLECEKQCVKAAGNVEATLTVGTETKPSADAGLLDAWQKKLPNQNSTISARAWWEQPASGDTRPFVVEWNSTQAADEADFFPYKSDTYEVEPATEKLPGASGRIRLRVRVKKSEGDWPKEISGVLVEGTSIKRTGHEVQLEIAAAAPPDAARSGPPRAETPDKNVPPLWKTFCFAFIGGLILNIMPCVLPVIALKILGFVSEARNEPTRVRKLGLIYTAGVLASFCALALIIVGLQVGGRQVGWGFQFTNPYFLIAMAVLITLVTLNLFGIFEVTLASNALTAANALASKGGEAGAFFNGLLATVLATSCSAPIFAPAVGYALTFNQPFVTVLVLLTAGLGLALPYLLLSWKPAWLKFLPRPGPWMQQFKIAMGFPMLAACVWLCSLVAVHYGDRAWWMVMFLVFVAVAAWIYGEFVQRGSRHRAVALLVSIFLLVAGYGFALENKLDWRKPIKEGDQGAQPSKVAPKGLPWAKWSPTAVATARAAGHPAVVDFTATWCPNCNLIVKPSLENAAVQRRLKEIGAVLLVSDYSLSDETLAADLKPFHRAAIPVLLVYSGKAETEPEVFDFVSPGIILDALTRATR